MVESEQYKAFVRMFDRHWENLFLLACAKVRSADAAKDLVQEAYMILWDRREILSNEAQVPAFLYGVLRNRILKLFEKNEVRLRYVLLASNGEQELSAAAHKLLLNK